MRAPHRFQRSTLLLVFAALSALVAPCASGQSRQTATRTAGVDVFGAFSDIDTAFYGTDRKYGGMAGVDFSLYRYFPRLSGKITPSLEIRGTDTPGTPVAERTVQGGLKVAYNWHALHPYADILVGGGTILFTPPAPLQPGYVYASDSSFLYVYGGGLAFDILPKWSLLADYGHQSWNLGFDPPVTFTPQSVSIGVVYHLRLKPFRQ